MVVLVIDSECAIVICIGFTVNTYHIYKTFKEKDVLKYVMNFLIVLMIGMNAING